MFDRDLVRVLACTMALLESGHSYVSVEFEVFGKVQGKLFFSYFLQLIRTIYSKRTIYTLQTLDTQT